MMKSFNSFFQRTGLQTNILLAVFVMVCFSPSLAFSVNQGPFIGSDGECYWLQTYYYEGVWYSYTNGANAWDMDSTTFTDDGNGNVSCTANRVYSQNFYRSGHSPYIRMMKWNSPNQRWSWTNEICITWGAEVYPAYTNTTWWTTWQGPPPADGCVSVNPCQDEYTNFIQTCEGEENIKNWDEATCSGECKTCEDKRLEYFAQCENDGGVPYWYYDACKGECVLPEQNSGPPDPDC